MRNFGLMIPQSFMTTFCECHVHVNFEFKQKWGEFTEWVIEGNLSQCQSKGKDIDVWIRHSDIIGLSPASLQYHFDQFCKPKTFGFHSYEIIKP